MRYLYTSLFFLMAASFVIAEELPLPFSSSDLTLADRSVPTIAAKPKPNDASQFESSASYSERSFRRFQRRQNFDLAQLGNEFPTNYMQDPETTQQVQSHASALKLDMSDSVANAESPADIPPAPGSDELDDVPPPPSPAEIENMFRESVSPPPELAAPVVEQSPIQPQFTVPVQTTPPLQLVPIQNGYSCTH